MAPKLDLEARMTIKKLKERGSTARSIAQVLGVTEGAVRYHLRRQAAGAADGRARQVHAASSHHEAIVAWLESQGYRVLRFWNNEVLGNIEGVLTVIVATVRKMKKP